MVIAQRFIAGLFSAVHPGAQTVVSRNRDRPTDVTVSTYGDMIVSLCVQAWQTRQFERVGVPLGEQVVHIGLAVVVSGPTVVTREVVRRGTDGVAEITGVVFHPS